MILPNKKRLTVKVGTEVVDRAWKFMKSRLTLNQNSKVGSTAIVSKVRSAQFEYWNRGRDMWELAHVPDHDQVMARDRVSCESLAREPDFDQVMGPDQVSWKGTSAE